MKFLPWLNPRKLVNSCHFYRFLVVFEKKAARVMGLLFGSAGAHTYLKSGKVAPPPSFLLQSLLYEGLLKRDSSVV